MTEQQQKIWVKTVLQDFKVYAKKYLKIKTKEGKIVPLILNKPQRIVLEAIEGQIQAGVPIRLLVLKARQKGISTLIEAYIFWRTSNRYHRSSAIVSHEAKSTDHLYGMFKRYYNNLPDSLKPEYETKNEKGLTYGKLDSFIKCWTAGSGDVASSYTLLDLHLSEIPKWINAKTTLISLLQTVPDHKDTMIIMEATAKGIGGEFYDRWQTAKEGKSNYTPVFLSWLVDDEYTLEFRDDEDRKQLEKSLDDIEYGLIEAGATMEHLNWRRRIGLPDKCGNDIDYFRQEYPSNDVEAFIASGSPVFDVNKCNIHFMEAQKFIPIMGNLEYSKYGKDGKGTEVIFVPNERGYIKIFDKSLLSPRSDDNPDGIGDDEMHRFANGADIAEGLAQGDYSVNESWDKKTEQVCMSWWGHIDPDLFGEELHKIYLFQKKKGQFAVEKNNHGYTTIKSAYKLGVPLYHNQTFDKGYPSDTGKIGFTTTGKSKAEIINDINEWIREGLLNSKNKQFWAEALRFVRNEKGQMQAQGKDTDVSVKSFDDEVIANALMIRCALWMPNYHKIPPKKIYARPSFEEVRESSYANF